MSYILHNPKQWCLWCRYAIASYLLQSKDRHNGNILIDTQGRLVHIDFGFILEISPGANMRFESAAFKLSHEMTQLLDPSGQRDSPQFHMFEELCVRGFLAVGVLTALLCPSLQSCSCLQLSMLLSQLGGCSMQCTLLACCVASNRCRVKLEVTATASLYEQW